MTTKTLSISEEAYNNLVRLKREGESFTQLILRLVSEKGTASYILETLDLISAENDDEIEELAANIEQVYKIRKTQKLREVNR